MTYLRQLTQSKIERDAFNLRLVVLWGRFNTISTYTFHLSSGFEIIPRDEGHSIC